MPTLGSLLLDATRQLRPTSLSPRLDAEVLLAFAMGISRGGLLSKINDAVEESRALKFADFLRRRRSGEPVAYITGVKEFWSLEFEVTPVVLIPRPETELLVERALQILSGRPGADSILDLGTGSGCVAVALAVELLKRGRTFKLLACDKSQAALEVARRNVVKHGLERRIELLASDWFKGLESARQAFDIIVCNPPYVAEEDLQVSADLRYEPQAALCGGVDGLMEIRKIVSEVEGYLKPQGVFLCEIGSDQRADLEKELLALKSAGALLCEQFTFLKDLAGRDRVLELKRATSS